MKSKEDRRDPPRIVQIYDPVAQAVYEDWSAETKLEWLESIMQLYWVSREESASSLPLAAESRKPFPNK